MSGAIDEDVRGIRKRLRWAIWRATRGGVGMLELERRAGLSRGELRQIQRKGCARVPVAKFRRISDVLGVRVAWLVLGDVMAKHHEPPCRVEEARQCGECGRWPWEACDADA